MTSIVSHHQSFSQIYVQQLFQICAFLLLLSLKQSNISVAKGKAYHGFLHNLKTIPTINTPHPYCIPSLAQLNTWTRGGRRPVIAQKHGSPSGFELLWQHSGRNRAVKGGFIYDWLLQKLWRNAERKNIKAHLSCFYSSLLTTFPFSSLIPNCHPVFFLLTLSLPTWFAAEDLKTSSFWTLPTECSGKQIAIRKGFQHYGSNLGGTMMKHLTVLRRLRIGLHLACVRDCRREIAWMNQMESSFENLQQFQ